MSAEFFVGLLILLFFADAVTTDYIIRRGGVELNPVLAWLMDRLGRRQALLFVKAAALAVIVALLPWLTDPWRIAIVAMYVAIVGWNLFTIHKLKRAV